MLTVLVGHVQQLMLCGALGSHVAIDLDCTGIVVP
jgi:hypothetical protein